jgi:hypothetical protein
MIFAAIFRLCNNTSQFDFYHPGWLAGWCILNSTYIYAGCLNGVLLLKGLIRPSKSGRLERYCWPGLENLV